MNDFKFNYYLNLYKDKSMGNRNEFRKNFRKKHGKYNDIEKLIVAIEKYQFDKYGQTLNSQFVTTTHGEELDKIYKNERVKRCYKKKHVNKIF